MCYSERGKKTYRNLIGFSAELKPLRAKWPIKEPLISRYFSLKRMRVSDVSCTHLHIQKGGPAELTRWKRRSHKYSNPESWDWTGDLVGRRQRSYQTRFLHNCLKSKSLPWCFLFQLPLSQIFKILVYLSPVLDKCDLEGKSSIWDSNFVFAACCCFTRTSENIKQSTHKTIFLVYTSFFRIFIYSFLVKWYKISGTLSL